MKLYKLTDADDRTHGGCQWGPGVTVETSGAGELCGPGFTHWQTDPALAVMLNPAQGRFDLATAHLWAGEGEIVKDDCSVKVGCTRATTLWRVTLPVVSDAARVRFGILCALEVNAEPTFRAWAEGWLSGRDRGAAAATVAGAAGAAAAGARGAARVNASWALWGAAWAARALAVHVVFAARAARARERKAGTSNAARMAVDARVNASGYAASAATWAAWAAQAGRPLDLAALARRAVEEEAAIDRMERNGAGHDALPRVKPPAPGAGAATLPGGPPPLHEEPCDD